MNVQILLLSLTLSVFSACEGSYWSAKWHLVKGDAAHTKAYQLRTKKVPYEERLKYYEAACHHFTQAHEKDPKIFTLYYIDLAEESCSRIDDEKDKILFRKFRDEYAKNHPVEAEHGDAGVEIMMSE